MRHDFIALPSQRKSIRKVLLGSSFLLSLLAVSHVANAAPAELEGELEVLHVHNFDKTTHESYFLRGNDGKRYELKFKKHAPGHITGTKIRVKGEQSGNVLALDSSTSTSSYQVLAMPAPNTFGEQKTAVLMVNFQDNQTQPYTTSQAMTTVFGNGNNFIKENSFQQTWLNGNVFGWYTLPIAQTCSPASIETYANQAAAAAGVDLSLYPRRIYVFPRNTTCSWSGMGSVGGSPTSVWLNGRLDRSSVTHEMGHNFGLYHSHSLDCGATTLGSSCTRSEYGDFADNMGASDVHYNAFQKERLGWLTYGISPSIATVETGSGTFTLEPYASSSSGTKALKVLKSTDPTTGQKTWYYVEFRQPIGFDASLSPLPAVLNGVLVRIGIDGNSNSSDLLDMTPNSSTYDDLSDSPLSVGRSYTDSTSGVTISLLSVSSSGATVSVSMNGQTPTPTCTHANPGIALSGQSASVAPGTAVTYTVSVTNADSSACSSSQFNLSSVVPAGWTVNPASATLNLAPGSSGSTSVVVTSPTTATAGFYTISGKAVNSSAISFTASASTTYTVATSSTTPPTTPNKPPVAVSDSVATTAGTAVKISVLVNDSDPEGKALTIKSVGLPARGTAVVNADGTVTYKPNGKFKGSDSFSYTISDGVNTASATASVQVTR